jgi:hypothetical protein
VAECQNLSTHFIGRGLKGRLAGAGP